MLMPNEIKIIVLPVPFLPGALHLPLQLDDFLAQDEPSLKETHEHMQALDRYFLHFFGELGNTCTLDKSLSRSGKEQTVVVSGVKVEGVNFRKPYPLF